jgi:hypothetical protein
MWAAPTESGEYTSINVGCSGKEVVDLVPGDAQQAVFEFDVDVRNGKFSGPYIQGGVASGSSTSRGVSSSTDTSRCSAEPSCSWIPWIPMRATATRSRADWA